MSDDEKKKVDETIEVLDAKIVHLGAITTALIEVVVRKGIVTAEELTTMIERCSAETEKRRGVKP